MEKINWFITTFLLQVRLGIPKLFTVSPMRILVQDILRTVIYSWCPTNSVKNIEGIYSMYIHQEYKKMLESYV